MSGVCVTHIINEPNQANNEKTITIKLQDQAIRRAGILHRVTVKLLGFLELQTQDEKDQGEEDADAQTGPPDGFVVFVAGCGGHDVGDEGADDEAPVDHGVGEEDEPAVSGAVFELAGGLGAAYAAGWILA